MNRREFETRLSAARHLCPSAAYRRGYERGLRRLYHGQDFGTQEEHDKFLSLVGDVDPDRAETGRGYADGFAGRPVLETDD